MTTPLDESAITIPPKQNKKFFSSAVFAVFVLLIIFYYFFIKPPDYFPSGGIYSVEENRTLSEVAIDAKKSHIIKSVFALKVLIVLFSENKNIISGDYVFAKKENVFKIAERFAKGDYKMPVVKVTVPEGLNIYEVSELLSKKEDLRNFSPQEFVSLAKDKEGYLYPDTYFFLPNSKAGKIIEIMENNFTKKTAPIRKELEKASKMFEEIVTMASILEKEVPLTKDRKIVAGILWKRIEIGMPLQVDAVFPYITQRKDKTITRVDLKIDSPYNTYINKGLPPGPISNPSLDAILAAINPTETKYLFYISDKSGITRFASTFEEHNNNIEKYLR